MKYRIKEETIPGVGTRYYPQRKFLWMWWYMHAGDETTVSFCLIENAVDFLDKRSAKVVVKYHPYP